MRPLDADVRPVAEKTLDPFVSIQNSLRQQGATYYLLETVGGQQPNYRFYCKMSIGGNPNYTRPFEASDADPLRAMSLVLQQVEAWRFRAVRICSSSTLVNCHGFGVGYTHGHAAPQHRNPIAQRCAAALSAASPLAD